MSARPTAPPPDDPAVLRAEIERTRLELGETVAALAEKTDVKTRAKEKVAEVRQTAQQKRTALMGNVQQKRTELAGKARESSPDGAGSAAVQVRDSASSAAVQVREKARQNPVPTAAIAAFVGGMLLGRIMKRR